MSTRPTTLAVLVCVLAFALGAALARFWHGEYAIVLFTLSLGAVQLRDDQYRARAHRIREALGIVGIPLTTAAREYMQMDPGDFVRALSGERKLDDWRLEMLGDEFMRVLALLELRDRGLPDLAQTALKITPSLLDIKRSA